MNRILFVTSIFALACSTAHAVPITLFTDVDTYIERAQDIVIAKCISIPEKGSESFHDGLYPATVEVVTMLKGGKKPGRLTIATIYETQPKTTYLLCSLGGGAFDTDFLALPELSVVPVADNFDLEKLKGKTTKQQVQLIMARYLFDIEQKLAPLRETERLLHQAIKDRRDNVYQSAGDVKLAEIRAAATTKGNPGIFLDLPPGRLEWSHSSPSKSGYFYFQMHGENSPEWEFAATDHRDFKSFSGKPFEATFYGSHSPGRDQRLGQSSGNAIKVEVGQIVLARTVKDPARIYVLKIESQAEVESMTVQYAVLPRD